MAAVAKGRILRRLAAAKKDLLGLFEGKNHGHKRPAFVGTVAEWLILRLAAGAPRILARFEGQLGGTGRGNFGFAHGKSFLAFFVFGFCVSDARILFEFG
jgi:hypothetical protein